jgi:ubiquinone/menaquinone biosynthesis C-methylase UbiE
MASENNESKPRSNVFEYLCVDRFLEGLNQARALATAFEMGLIDFMLQKKNISPESLSKHWGVGLQALHLLLSLLLANRVIKYQDGHIKLTDEFLHALQFRDLLELKLQISNFAAHDFLDYFSDMVCRPGLFAQKSNFRRLFSYNRCFDNSKESYEATKRWMQITTILTKYESQVCMKYHDFSPYRHILDIGGNSGEFALQICKRYPKISATVFDLPLVCDIGVEHLQSEQEAKRITFIKGNALTDDFPKGFDLVLFKSMLHDWPDKEAKQFMTKASQSLKSGGTLLIFERGPFEPSEMTLDYSVIPFLLFSQSFRSPAIYRAHLMDLALEDITVERIDLGTPFYLVAARKDLSLSS